MKVARVRVTPVNVPLIAPIRWAWGIRTGITRNVIHVETDDGLIGLGETMGGAHITDLLQALGGRLLGQSPFALEPILAQYAFTSYFHGYGGFAAVAGLEMALWDLMGKAAGRPLYDLLGGLYRSEVPFSAYVFYRYRSGDVGGETTAEDIAAYCRRLRDDAGFAVWKLKAGVFPPEHDLDVLRVLREELGRDAALRVDPNGVWSPQTTLRMRPPLEALALEYLEDPTWGLDAMARVRSEIRVPLATNMCVVDFEQVPVAVRLRAVDIVLGDVHKWGGILAVKKLATVCQTFDLGLSLHSGCELGISTAANLHVAGSTPHLRYALDSHYMHQSDDIVQGGKFQFAAGCLPVPRGPGLGVELDETRFHTYADLHRREGHLGSVGDPRRPEFVPARVMW